MCCALLIDDAVDPAPAVVPDALVLAPAEEVGGVAGLVPPAPVDDVPAPLVEPAPVDVLLASVPVTSI
jgi:hypothetical protein